MSFDASREIFEALTYDDVLLLPAYSEVLPKDVDTTTYLTRNIQLNIPLISAAMDTVTDAEMAIAMAQEGGIGMIHKSMSIERQAAEVRKVKRSQSGMILDPITLPETATLADAHRIMADYKIGGIPVINPSDELIGIITNRDLRFQKDLSISVTHIMTRENLITAPEGIDLQKAEDILQEYKIEKLPIVNKQGKLIGLITYKDILKKKDRPYACKDEYGRLRVGAAVGVTSDVMARIEALQKAGVDVISIDTAHGHSKGVIDTLKAIKATFKNLDVIAGNIATGEAALALAQAGADAVKVGIGPGSICTTRVIAGVGVPQFYAVWECASALKDMGVPVIADGGIRFSGDVVKAIAGGASSIMAGSLFAGTEEAPGEIVIYEGRKYKGYRGMGSVEAMEEGSKDRYFQDTEVDKKKLVPEGIVGRVPFKGPVSEVIYQLIGGLKAGMGYCGAKDIPSLKKAKFVKITAAGVRESHPHDIQIIKEAPNYSR
ncbi:MAG: IMP dehydrogenase [Microscillaceae bacterium]|jgi:IMP dehydrogenase|nr:IMP dehydrogenase [Microscillaceae bacterium]